ncbi:ubiquitin-like protein [Anaeromyces robustus]|jgi:DNA repair exonuclease SbcCD ATPase subunit|uniref:Ubiquitin-like protein n=1 Tax=Anaeromyces robustus TaxID=1754192 RepID=A0A1Y1WYN8_9FUNG|nr:ubiquitin-like protein [Anaeromyces robustus]|eukprot:ORX78671.1 ubiquitin-like protein [Anaeromyces robustus]
MGIKNIMKKKTVSHSSSLKKKIIRDNEDANTIKDDNSSNLSNHEKSELMKNRNGSTETLVDLVEHQTNNTQSQFDAFKTQMLKMFEEQEKKHNAIVETLLQKINMLTEENNQYKAKVNELEKKLNKLENNTEVMNKVQGLEQKVETLEDQYLEQSQSVSQREISDDQIVQTMDLAAQNNRDFINLQKQVDKLEKSEAKILENHSFMSREVERLNSFVINNEEIKVNIYKRGESTFTIKATPAETIADLKKHIQRELNCEPKSQILNFKGRSLEDEFTLHDYNVVDGSTVQLALRC